MLTPSHKEKPDLSCKWITFVRHFLTAFSGVWFALLIAAPSTAKDEDTRVLGKASVPPAGPQRIDHHGDPLPPEALARLGTVRFRNDEYFHSLAYTADGRILVSGGHGGARAWDAATGKLLRNLGSELENPYGPAGMSPDGKLLAVGGWGSVQGGAVYEIASGRRLYRFGFPSLPVNGTFSPDGKILAAYPRNDGAIVLLDAGNGKELRALRGHFEVGSQWPEVAFSPDSKMLVSGEGDGFVRVWDIASGKKIRQIKAGTTAVSSMCLSPDRSRLATVNLTVLNTGGGMFTTFPDNRVRVWEMSTGQERFSFLIPPTEVEKSRAVGPALVTFTPDGKAIVTAGWAQPLRLWDAETGKKLRQLGTKGVSAIAFAPGAKTIAVAEGHSIRVRDFSSGRDLISTGGHRNSISLVAISPDGRTIATGGDDHVVMLWDVSSGKERSLKGHGAAIEFLRFSADGATLYSGGRDKTFRTWDPKQGRELRSITIESRVYAVSGDGRTLITVSKEGIVLRDADTGRERRTFKTRTDNIAALAFNANDKALRAWSMDGKLHRWEVESGRHDARECYRVENWPFDAVYSPDGRLMTFAVQNSTFVPVVDMASGREICRFPIKLHQNMATIAWPAFSPDSRTLAWGGPREAVTLGEIAAGKVRHQFVGHRGCVRAVAWSADGKHLVSAGADTTALVWDLTGPLPGRTANVARLSDADLTACWRDLGSADAAQAICNHSTHLRRAGSLRALSCDSSEAGDQSGRSPR